MNRLVLFCSGLLLMCSFTGCCLFPGGGCGYGGYGAGYPSGYPYNGGGPGGNCGAAAPGYRTAFAPGYPAAAFAPGTVTAYVDPVPTY